MAEEGGGGEGEIEQRVLDTPDRDRDPSASTLTRPKADCPHTRIEKGARPKETVQSVTDLWVNKTGWTFGA